MQQRVSRLPAHQNAKVIAILMAVVSLIFVIPFFFLASIFGLGARAPVYMLIVVPLLYLIFGYITAVIGCALYNVLVPLTGGFEFESAGSPVSPG